MYQQQMPQQSMYTQPVASATMTYQAVIPPNCYPGSSFDVNIGGRLIRIQVPPGSAPGQQIAFQAPAPVMQQQPMMRPGQQSYGQPQYSSGGGGFSSGGGGFTTGEAMYVLHSTLDDCFYKLFLFLDEQKWLNAGVIQ